MTKTKRKLGRPPLYKTPLSLQNRIQEYFKLDEEATKTPTYTISGLALHLGFCSRQSFYAYENKPEFSYTIKRARLFMERHYEELIQGSTPTGAIFALKNFGWIDKAEEDPQKTTINVFIKNIIQKAGINDQSPTTNPSNTESQNRLNKL